MPAQNKPKGKKRGFKGGRKYDSYAMRAAKKQKLVRKQMLVREYRKKHGAELAKEYYSHSVLADAAAAEEEGKRAADSGDSSALSQPENSPAARDTPATEARRASGKGSGRKLPPGDYVCNLCGIAGHWIQQCPTKDSAGAGKAGRVKKTKNAKPEFWLQKCVDLESSRAKKKAERDERAAAESERRRRLKQQSKRRRRTTAKLEKRSSRGQPIMRNQIDHLLRKIQAQKRRDTA
jgi:hypothetical protein